MKKKKSPLFLASFLFKCHPCCMKCLSTFIHTTPNFRWARVFFVKPSVNFQAHIVMVPCAFIGHISVNAGTLYSDLEVRTLV